MSMTRAEMDALAVATGHRSAGGGRIEIEVER